MLYNKKDCLPEYQEKLKFLDNIKDKIVEAAFILVDDTNSFLFSCKHGLNIVKNYESLGAVIGHCGDSNISEILSTVTGLHFYKSGWDDADIRCVEFPDVYIEFKMTSGYGLKKQYDYPQRYAWDTYSYCKFSSHTNCSYESGVYKNVDALYIQVQVNLPYDIHRNFIQNNKIELARVYIGYFKHDDFIGSSSSSYLSSEKYMQQGYDIYFNDYFVNDIKHQIKEHNAKYPTKREEEQKEKIDFWNSLNDEEKADAIMENNNLKIWLKNHNQISDTVYKIIDARKNKKRYEKEVKHILCFINYINKFGSEKGFSSIHASTYQYFRVNCLLPRSYDLIKEKLSNMGKNINEYKIGEYNMFIKE